MNLELRKKPLRQYKYITFLTMLFITIFIVCDTTAFRMVDFWGNIVPLSGLIIPVVFALGDIIAETYGFHITMKIVKSGIVCQFLFGIIMTIVLAAPSPPNNILNQHYNFAFQHIIRTNITSCFSVTSGMFANAFLISKLKIYMNGKKFWFRTIISSGISEIVLCTVAYLILFSGLKSFTDIIRIIYSVWIYKMVFSIVVSPLVSMIGRTLKIIENSDVYDIGISYNPFAKTTDSLLEFDDKSKKLSEKLDKLEQNTIVGEREKKENFDKQTPLLDKEEFQKRFTIVKGGLSEQTT